MKNRFPLHYGWLIVLAGTCCIFACLGFGRFALGMLLPAMGASLGIDYSEMGLISTANFSGYLVAVLCCARVQARIGARCLITSALVLVGLSMILIGWADSLVPVILLYTLTGIGSGGANVPMMGLVSAWFAGRVRGRATGFVVIGSGFAILLSGRLIPALNAVSAEGWRTSWLLLGGVVFLVGGLLRPGAA